MENQAYVYAYEISGEIRYIGKGHGLRASKHLSYAKQLIKRRREGEHVKATRFYNGLASAIQKELPIQIRMLATGLSNAEAFELEQSEIARLRSQLWNGRDGGSGMTPNDAKALWKDPVYRETQRKVGQPARLAALWADPEFVKRQSAAASKRLKAFWNNPDNVRRQREGTQRKWQDPAHREWMISRLKVQNKAVNARPEKKAQQSALIKKMNADPEFQAKRLAALKPVLARQSAERAERMRKLHEDPEFRARMTAARNAAFAAKKLRKEIEKKSDNG